MAGAVVTALAMRLYQLAMEGIPGLGGSGSGARATA
jgi:hypothetical protein